MRETCVQTSSLTACVLSLLLKNRTVSKTMLCGSVDGQLKSLRCGPLPNSLPPTGSVRRSLTRSRSSTTTTPPRAVRTPGRTAARYPRTGSCSPTAACPAPTTPASRWVCSQRSKHRPHDHPDFLFSSTFIFPLRVPPSEPGQTVRRGRRPPRPITKQMRIFFKMSLIVE